MRFGCDKCVVPSLNSTVNVLVGFEVNLLEPEPSAAVIVVMGGKSESMHNNP